jgi:hypothetical protein
MVNKEKTMNFIKKSYYNLGAVMTVSMIAGASSDAFAGGGNNFSEISKNITTSISDLPGLLAALSYLFGVLLGVLGVMKIKDHVENPTQTPLKDGAIRLAAGGALFALPIMFESMSNTIGKGATVGSAKLKAAKFQMAP